MGGTLGRAASDGINCRQSKELRSHVAGARELRNAVVLSRVGALPWPLLARVVDRVAFTVAALRRRPFRRKDDRPQVGWNLVETQRHIWRRAGSAISPV